MTLKADILIAAAGVPNLIDRTMVKKGVDIIDVGINRISDSPAKEDRLVGDADYKSLIGHAGAITPVPGGVGPMTIAMLVENTIEAAKRLTNSSL